MCTVCDEPQTEEKKMNCEKTKMKQAVSFLFLLNCI